MIKLAFEDLSQSLRILLESRYGLNELLAVDFAEATGNIESGYAGVLNAFHSLYDAMRKDGVGSKINWYGTAELCIILALRNARHHNLCSKIRTIFRYHIEEVYPPTDQKRYLMLDFELCEKDAKTFDVPVSLGDLIKLLDLPVSQSKLGYTAKDIIWNYIDIDSAVRHAESIRLTANDVFFNVVPLIVNAGIAIHPHIRDRIKHISTESEHFDFHFREVLPARVKNHRYDEFEFGQP